MTETETKATEKEATLAELKRKIKELESEVEAKDSTIEEMKKKEEGWLVWTDNPMYNSSTHGIQFTDGMAFIPKERVLPRFVSKLPTEVQQRAMLNDAVKHPDGKEELETMKRTAKIPSSEMCVKVLTNDFGYHAQFFTKDQQDELQKRLTDRARERAEVQAKLGTESEMLEKLITRQQL